MIRVMVAYPRSEGSSFDWGYYLDSHMPLVREQLGDALLKDELDRYGDDQPYHAAVHLFFDSLDSFGSSMGAAGATLMSDIPNYTNTEAKITIAEVLA
jgi:uncharacterized protein (TIGR02118 family)